MACRGGSLRRLRVFPVQCLLLCCVDIFLYVLWGVLAVGGFSLQCYLERGRPQFPERSPGPRRRNAEPRAAELPARVRRANQLSERQPLLAGVAVTRHGAVGMSPPSIDTWPPPGATPAPMFPPPPPYSS